LSVFNGLVQCKWEKICKQIGTACRDGGIVKKQNVSQNNPSVSFADSSRFAKQMLH